ncbi:hypothetical protein JCM19241_10 [Vibrio ishigakensis]|uniref:Uncharacterized protein n=1 Tax=Vibrio ishigakensis TaxID=1481914 RepID=A0A0B8QJE7_9VIBR|nr:hypothetical protein JCM19241_10 [Vibrio ishigakensis]
MTEEQAYEFMGVTQAIGYMMPIIGGFIIDKYLAFVAASPLVSAF